MLALTHFATGAALGIGTIGPFIDEKWRPALMVASGIWAMGPDLNKFLPGLDGLHNGLWANVFWFHGLLDGWETAFPKAEAAVAVAFLAFATAFVTLKS
jgi:hypothetical protein